MVDKSKFLSTLLWYLITIYVIVYKQTRRFLNCDIGGFDEVRKERTRLESGLLLRYFQRSSALHVTS